MTEHHDEHGHGGHGGHGGPSLGDWMDQHMSGLIMPFGEKMETLFERTLVLSVNGFFLRVARISIVIITPVLLLEFAVRAMRF